MKAALRVAIGAALACAVAADAAAQTAVKGAAERYPTRPVRLISAFPPGGGASTIARLIAPELTELWGQAVVVDNRPGAGGSIGTEIAARAQPDGYTLVMATVSTVVINPLVGKLPYDPIRDFTPIVHTSTQPFVLIVHPSVPAKSVKELIAYARSPGARLNFASSGEGTISHLAGELFKNLARVYMAHVPYKGGGQSIIDVMAGHVQIGFSNILEALPQVNAGRLRGLGVTTLTRSSAAPNIPTIAEAGVPGYEVIQWNGVLGPAGLPRDLTSKVNADILRVLARRDIRERLTGAGAEPGGGTPEQFGVLIRSDIAKWAKVVKTVKLDVQR